LFLDVHRRAQDPLILGARNKVKKEGIMNPKSIEMEGNRAKILRISKDEGNGMVIKSYPSKNVIETKWESSKKEQLNRN
jgi:hypothetical protein